MVAANAAICHGCRVVGQTSPVAISIREVRAAPPDRITAASLMSQRSDIHAARNPIRSASTMSSIPWAGVRESDSWRTDFWSDATAPAITYALRSSTIGSIARPYHNHLRL